MNTVVENAELADLPALSDFFIKIFGLSANHPLASPEFLRWKYFAPRPGWQGSRSYVRRKEGQIIAHCCVSPTTFLVPNATTVSSITLLDWAANSSSPGVGVMLFRKLMEKAPTCFVTGAGLVARQMLPRLGFRQVGEAFTYSAWLRPWRELRARPFIPKSLLRVLHGWTHPASTRSRFAATWQVEQVDRFDDAVLSILGRPKKSCTICTRTLADLNFLLQCPHLEMQAFLLTCEGRTAGYFIVGKSDWEARVLDLVVDSEDANDWKGVCGAITRTIRMDPTISRIRIQATVPALISALAWNGYWCALREPIFMFDPALALNSSYPVAFQFFDGDSGY